MHVVVVCLWREGGKNKVKGEAESFGLEDERVPRPIKVHRKELASVLGESKQRLELLQAEGDGARLCDGKGHKLVWADAELRAQNVLVTREHRFCGVADLQSIGGHLHGNFFQPRLEVGHAFCQHMCWALEHVLSVCNRIQRLQCVVV